MMSNPLATTIKVNYESVYYKVNIKIKHSQKSGAYLKTKTA